MLIMKNSCKMNANLARRCEKSCKIRVRFKRLTSKPQLGEILYTHTLAAKKFISKIIYQQTSIS